MKSDMMTVSQAAEKWGLSVRTVQNLCKNARISGAVRLGKNWLIPVDSQRPPDKRYKENAGISPLVRKTPFLDMTDLYSCPGSADDCIKALGEHPEAQKLFAAEILYSRGDIDSVYKCSETFLNNHSSVYSVIAGSMLLSLCAMWKGDIIMWRKAKKHLFEAPCKNDVERDIVLFSNAAIDSAIRKTDDFPQWFRYGQFDKLPADSHPAAMVYYIKYLLIYAQELAMGKVHFDDVSGLGLMKTLPYIIEPLITQVSVQGIIMVEIYLRLLCGIAYHQAGDAKKAALHVDKAIALALPDKLYGPFVEHRRQYGLFLDERLALADAEALKKVKELHKQLQEGWTRLHNAILENSVSVNLTAREREIARLAAFGLSNTEIAERLMLSTHTVNTLIISAKNKTGADKRKDLSRYV